MTFTAAIRTCFSKYFTFSGRASRREYWWFFLFILLGMFALGFIEDIVNGATGEHDRGPTILTGAFNLATFVPSLAVGWRRMHDTGRSGLFFLYPLIVIIGISTYIGLFVGFQPTATGAVEFATDGLNAIVLMIAGLVLTISPLLVIWWLTRPSQRGPNEYGPNPHGATQ